MSVSINGVHKDTLTFSTQAPRNKDVSGSVNGSELRVSAALPVGQDAENGAGSSKTVERTSTTMIAPVGSEHQGRI